MNAQRITFTLEGARRNGKGIGNCVVLALTAATGLPYAEVEKAMKKQGCYRQGRGTRTTCGNLKKVGKMLGFTVTEHHWDARNIGVEYNSAMDHYKANSDDPYRQPRNQPKTFGGFTKTKKSGNWVVCNHNHGVAICNGELIDNGFHIPTGNRQGRWNRRATKAFKIEMTNATTPAFESQNISTSNPGTQLNIFA